MGMSEYLSLPKGAQASYKAFCEVCTINKRWSVVFTGGGCLDVSARLAACSRAVCGLRREVGRLVQAPTGTLCPPRPHRSDGGTLQNFPYLFLKGVFDGV